MEEEDKHVMRIVIFKGHDQEENSRLVCKIYDDYTLLPKQISLNPECSARTVMNLLNLHTIRGNLHVKSKSLDLETSMSGPYHYWGYLEPTKCYHLHLTDPLKKFEPSFPRFTETDHPTKKMMVQQEKNKFVNDTFGCVIQQNEMQWTSHCLPKSENSLFSGPGKLWINKSEFIIPTLPNSHLWDLSLFKVQLIDLSKEPIQFNLEEVSKFSEAQHRLRLISYYYGSEYYSHYCMQKGGTGAFLEHHPFIQFITPLQQSTSGFVIVGRYLEDKSLQLISIEIPFGFCLIVNPHAIHGDSNLKGLYLMGMTGNHNAMNTADTVFLHSSNGPISIRSDKDAHDEDDERKNYPKFLLITHYQQPYWLLKQVFTTRVERQVHKNVKRKYGALCHAFWRTKIVNPFGYWPTVYNQI